MSHLIPPLNMWMDIHKSLSFFFILSLHTNTHRHTYDIFMCNTHSYMYKFLSTTGYNQRGLVIGCSCTGGRRCHINMPGIRKCKKKNQNISFIIPV